MTRAQYIVHLVPMRPDVEKRLVKDALRSEAVRENHSYSLSFLEVLYYPAADLDMLLEGQENKK